MKTGLVLVFAFVLAVGAATAQKVSLTRRLVQEEVPVSIVNSLKKDFAGLPDKGYWKLDYTEDVATKRLTADSYTYICKSDGKRVEVAYKADGTLDHAKGVEAQSTGSGQ